MEGLAQSPDDDGYRVKPQCRAWLAGVLSVDGSCRPQIVPDTDPSAFGQRLRSMRRRTGFGAVLNTSFNIHGQPLVCTPVQAIDVLVASGADWLAIGRFSFGGRARERRAVDIEAADGP
jgi:carbamoyltransferase